MSRRSRTNSARRAAQRARKQPAGNADSTGSTRRACSGDRTGNTRPRAPWNVTCVFDPEGTGHDFGYTVGLAKMGHPELHMWARPTHGTDPGADFRLSPQDICSLLNTHAELLVGGELEPGSEFARDLDAGMTEARITVGEAVHPRDVEALGVQPGARVLPLRWQLIREPVGAALPVPSEVSEQIERLTLHWRRLVEDLGGSPFTTGVDTSHTQAQGPWTPALVAAREAVGILGARGELSLCIDILGDRSREIGHSIAITAAVARRHGRSGAFETATTAAMEDARAAITPRDPFWEGMSDDEIRGHINGARRLLGTILGALYGHMVVLEHLLDCGNSDHELASDIHATVLSVAQQAASVAARDRPDPDSRNEGRFHDGWPDAS